jgi:predicted kinase
MKDIHSSVIADFIKNFPYIVYTLKTCEHGVDLIKPNKYHIEGDVWTHTCIAYQSLRYINEFVDLDDDSKLIACIATLCHDLGKPYVKQITKKNYFRFIGHEKRSVQEFIKLSKYFFYKYKLSCLDLYNIQLIINAHSVYWQHKNINDVVKFLNYNNTLLDIYKIVCTADMRGQITDVPKNDSLISTVFETNMPFEKNDYDKEFVILVGCPAAGKDSFITNSDKYSSDKYSIVSFDQIRIDLYTKEFGDTSDNYDTLYKKAWEYCNNKKYNLEDIMFNDYISKIYHNVIISNTNLTIKSRKRLINRLYNEYDNCKITIIYIYLEESELIERDLHRGKNDKTVGEDVITSMFHSIDVPTSNENVDQILVLYNG